MLSIPNDKTIHSKEYTLLRTKQSNVDLFHDLLEIISNDILFTDIVSLSPFYLEDDTLLKIVVYYLDY